MTDGIERSKYAIVRANRLRAFELLATGMQPRRVAHALTLELEVSRNTANKYVAFAIAQLMRDQEAEPLASKKARIVAALADNAQAARGKVTSYVNKDGEHRERDDADFRASNQALALIAQIEGVTK